MKKVFILCFGIVLIKQVEGQDSTVNTSLNTDQQVSMNDKKLKEGASLYPYKTSWKKDAPIVVGGIGLSYLGVTLIQNKKDLTLSELATKTKDKVPFFDRGNVGFYSDKINKDSYVPFYASFAMPAVILLLNKNERRNASSIFVMYLESLSITGTLFTFTAGLIDRPRPMVFGPSNAPDDKRILAKNQRSFYAGHTAASATGTFFAAKVFSDLNPDSKLKPVVWTVAAAIPAVVGYMRYKSGYHFLSDNLLGYALGAASGILIPEWHKTKAYKNVSFVPQIGKYNGFSFIYKIK
jgi:hypothetical protein